MSAFANGHSMRLAWAAALLLVPSVAFANSGIGYFMMVLPVLVIALLPVIPLEAAVLWRMLKLPFKRALYLAFIANLWSTLVGIVLGVVLDVALIGLTGTAGPDPTRGAAAVALVPMFFITWWLEYGMIKKRLAELPPARVRWSTAAANLVSYVVMMACVLIFWPERGRSSTTQRAYVSEAILSISPLRTSVQEFWHQQKRFPADLKELGITEPDGPKHSLSLAANGLITVSINRPSVPGLHGKRVQVRPVVQGDTLTWKCGSPDIDAKFLPSPCREPMP